MSWTIRALAMAVLIPSGAAAFEGGGGISMGHTWLAPTDEGWAGGTDIAAPKSFHCVGARGYGLLKIFRFGAEGYTCVGQPYLGNGSWLAYAGPQLGLQFGRSFYGAGTVTLGGGSQSIEGLEAGRLNQIFALAKSTATMGIVTGNMAIELSVFATLPISLAAAIDTDPVTGSMPMNIGLELALLWGQFGRQHAKPTTTNRDEPGASHTDTPAPVQPSDLHRSSPHLSNASGDETPNADSEQEPLPLALPILVRPPQNESEPDIEEEEL